MRAMKKQNRPTPLSFTNLMENMQGPLTCPNFMHSTSSPISFANNFLFDRDVQKSAPSSPWLTAIPPPSFTDVLQAIQTYNLLHQVQQNLISLPQLNMPPPSVQSKNVTMQEVSRKVFVGGLSLDITGEVLKQIFSKFGDVEVDWPDLKTGGQCNGYVFLIYKQMESVQHLLTNCHLKEDGRFFYSFGYNTAQIRPWYLKDGTYSPDPDANVDIRNAVFVGGVPRPATAEELHDILGSFGKVVFASIDVDPEYHYPKGAGRVIFAEHKDFLKAINSRFVTMDKQGCHRKDIEIKPYVIQNQFCDQCDDEIADLFCSDISCVQYYCRGCFNSLHANRDKFDHRIVVRDGERTKEVRRMQNFENCLNDLENFHFS